MDTRQHETKGFSYESNIKKLECNCILCICDGLIHVSV